MSSYQDQLNSVLFKTLKYAFLESYTAVFIVGTSTLHFHTLKYDTEQNEQL